MISSLMSNSEAALRCTDDRRPQTDLSGSGADLAVFLGGCSVVFAPSPCWDAEMQRCRVVLHNFAVRQVASCAALLIPDVHS